MTAILIGNLHDLIFLSFFHRNRALVCTRTKFGPASKKLFCIGCLGIRLHLTGNNIAETSMGRRLCESSHTSECLGETNECVHIWKYLHASKSTRETACSPLPLLCLEQGETAGFLSDRPRHHFDHRTRSSTDESLQPSINIDQYIRSETPPA